MIKRELARSRALYLLLFVTLAVGVGTTFVNLERPQTARAAAVSFPADRAKLTVARRLHPTKPATPKPIPSPAPPAPAPTPPVPPPPPPAAPTAPPVNPSIALTRGRGNAYTPGQCTYYAASRRNIPNHWGNAINWLRAARAAGFATGSTPKVGAIAWSHIGHVAIVEAVMGNMVRISEMNFNGHHYVTYRTVPASYFTYIY